MSTDDADTNKDAEDAVTEDAATEKSAATAKPELSKTETATTEKKVATEKQPAAEKKAASEAGATASGPAGAKRSASLPLIAAFAAGVLAVAAITAVVVFFLQGKDRGEKLDAIRDSTQAACTFGKDVSVYDYTKNLDDYFTKVKSGASGEFLKEFDDATKALKDAMVQAQVKSWVDDVQCGYQSGDKTEAKVLVTLTQYRTNFTQSTPERQFVVVIAQLTKSGDKWLVEKLDSPMLKGAGTGLPGAPGAPVPGEAPAPAPAPAPSGQPAPQPGN
ncbi:hypothetical protein NONI108955_39240 [Nocardia ninae]|uniref:Mce-associated membrane protein n=1 Tax=Nocardia ninae NBRC 108245 TaxID=1210091 RepID=A0A511MQV1_9NOCA|nr:hypothetical protein [Nocardia ninae]GEM42587.1 hypothetical protein NN4_71060 [Nocardia ninae NBRC 108245]